MPGQNGKNDLPQGQADAFERARQLGAALTDESTVLNDLIADAEARILGFGLGVTTALALPQFKRDGEEWDRALGFERVGKDWRLVIKEGKSTLDEWSSTVPLANASRDARLAGARQLTNLLGEMVELARPKLKTIQETNEILRDFLASTQEGDDL